MTDCFKLKLKDDSEKQVAAKEFLIDCNKKWKYHIKKMLILEYLAHIFHENYILEGTRW